MKIHFLKVNEHYTPFSNDEKEEKMLKKFQIESYFDTLLHQVPTEVPESLCCAITMEIMRDPVMTTSGISYERTAILTHFETNGNFDPITRKECNPWEVISNVNLKKYIEIYLDNNPWAYPEDEIQL